jgi:uncharacterized protein (TIGR00299 family) protein
VKQKAVAVFQRIAEAEGRIHGHPPEQVHFHEVGAVDSIVDIVGACIALEMLGKPRVQSAAPVEGTGWIHCAHGRFPIPAPATLAILGARGVPLSQCEEPQELITPTGAALLAEFAESFGLMRGLVAEKIGFGIGSRENRTRPNVLRAVLGSVSGVRVEGSDGHDWETDTVAVIETNIDDISAEILGHFVEKALTSGALDVFHTPIQMKKNRPGTLLRVLSEPGTAQAMASIILRETSAIGVRLFEVRRLALEREQLTVSTRFGPVAVKRSISLDGSFNLAPEYEDCKRLARQHSAPLKTVYDAALAAALAAD